jgi:hypothetical protein
MVVQPVTAVGATQVGASSDAPRQLEGTDFRLHVQHLYPAMDMNACLCRLYEAAMLPGQHRLVSEQERRRKSMLKGLSYVVVAALLGGAFYAARKHIDKSKVVSSSLGAEVTATLEKVAGARKKIGDLSYSVIAAITAYLSW